MSDHERRGRGVVTAARPPKRTEAETVEVYEDGDEVVLFDAENPLAWVESSLAVRLADRA